MKLTLDVSPEAVKRIEALKGRTGILDTVRIFRHALATYDLLTGVIAEGGKVHVITKSGETKILVLEEDPNAI